MREPKTVKISPWFVFLVYALTTTATVDVVNAIARAL